MSADEFDVDIERMFAQTPRMADSELFASRVDARLASGSRFRAVALTAAGLVGGVFAVRESMQFNFDVSSADAPTRTLGQGVQAAGGGAGDLIQTVVDQVGLSGMPFGSMGGMQLFWIVAATLVFVAAAGVVKLSQEA